MDNNDTGGLKGLEKLATLLHEVERVKRVARRPDEREATNTAEHSFELAVFCWYIVSVNKLDLNLEKVFKYAIAHDIVEAYAGDTPIHDEEAKKTKVERESRALERLEKEFPEFQEFTKILHEYERRDLPESRFVYAADKLIDPLNLSMETTQSIWKELDISFDTLIKHKKDKISYNNTILKYWNKLVKKLEDRKEFFFHK